MPVAKKRVPPRAVKVRPVSAPIVKRREELGFTESKLDLLKRTIAKGCDNDQLALFVHVCKTHRLDPFTRQIYCVLFPVSKHHQDEKGIWVSGHEMVIITGIGGYRSVAARDHADYVGSSDGKFTWFDPPRKTPAGRLIPESATVQVMRKGAPPTTATVYWEEFAPRDLTAARSDFWNRMPKNQLEKCAESKALRKAFPALGNMFTDVEMSQRLQDLTAGGREIVDATGHSPSGRALTYEAQQQDRVLELAEGCDYPANGPRAKQAQAALERVAEEDTRLKSEAEARKSPPIAKNEQSTGTIEPCLTFQFHEESKMAEIDGDTELKTANRDLLKPHYDGGTKKILLKPDDFFKLQGALEKRGVPLKAKQI
jgi:phage recombination protein Bet